MDKRYSTCEQTTKEFGHATEEYVYQLNLLFPVGCDVAWTIWHNSKRHIQRGQIAGKSHSCHPGYFLVLNTKTNKTTRQHVSVFVDPSEAKP